MFFQQADTALFTIRNEIFDWFNELVYESFGQNGPFRKKSINDGHFNIYSEIEICGDETQIIDAIEFVRNTAEITRYKMPWIIGNPFYVINETRRKLGIQELENLKQSNYGTIYKSTPYNIIGTEVYLFNFPPDLDDNEMIEIDKIFKYLAEPTSIFITNPNVTLQPSRQLDKMGLHILTLFHGAFLPYLSLEDIMSLDMANQNGNSCWDDDLAHDIRMFLLNKLPKLFDATTNAHTNLTQFRYKETILHFIHKYGKSIRNCSIPNIFTTQEIHSLSNSHNISFVYNEIIHIDFKTVDKPKIANFCALFDCGTTGFLNYATNYAYRNSYVTFGNDNEILDTTNTVNEFTRFFIKSRKDCLASTTNALLKYLPKTFKACQFENFQSTLILCEFELNLVSDEVFSDLLVMMRDGNIIFEKISIRLSILITILEKSVGNRIIFRRCRIIQDKIEELTNYSQICVLSFCDMDIELNIIRIFNNIDYLQFVNCHILHNNQEDLRHFRDVTHGAKNVHFVCCDFPRCNIVEQNYFSVRKNLHFKSMAIKLQKVFQILQKCEIQNRVFFENCHFRFERVSNLLFELKPAVIIFRDSTFDSLGLYTILRKLHRESIVLLERSHIMPRVEHFDDTASNTMILVKKIIVKDCTIDTATILNYLSKISSTILRIENCKLLFPRDFSFPNNSIHTKKLVFYKVNLTQRHLITILNCFTQNSIVTFQGCEIIGSDCEVNNFNQEHEIIIRFVDMNIDLNTPVFQQKNWKVYLGNCKLINTNVYKYKTIESSVTFRNMRFDTDAEFKLFENFTKTSKITFSRCIFDYLYENVIIKPRYIEFENVVLKIKMLHAFMGRIAADTIVVFNKCQFVNEPPELSARLILVRSTYFLNMQMDVKTILWVLKNFTKNVEFKRCTISESPPNAISDATLHLKQLILKKMNLEVNVFVTFVRVCASEVFLVIEKCNFIPVPKSLILPISLCIRHLLFIDVDYSSGFLQSLQNLNDNCYVELKSRLSSKSVLEICTTTPIHGHRLKLSPTFYTKIFYFELLTTYFESLLPSFMLKTEIIYDMPSFMPVFHGNELPHNWKEFKIRGSSVNGVTVKVDFLRGDEPIDLFYLLNDLPDDTETPFGDYRTD